MCAACAADVDPAAPAITKSGTSSAAPLPKFRENFVESFWGNDFHRLNRNTHFSRNIIGAQGISESGELGPAGLELHVGLEAPARRRRENF